MGAREEKEEGAGARTCERAWQERGCRVAGPLTKYPSNASPMPGCHHYRAGSRCGTNLQKPRKGPGNRKYMWRHCTARFNFGVRYPRVETELHSSARESAVF